MKTSSVVFGSIVVAGAGVGVQAAPFFGVPSDLSLSALIGRGLTGDSHKPESKLLDHGNHENKHDNKEVQKHDKGVQKDDKKNGGQVLAVGMDMNMDMDMCANIVVNGVLTQDCDKKGPSGSGKDNKDGKHDHGNGQKANNGGKKPNDGKDRSQKQEPPCEDNLISMQMKMEALRSDNERIKRKLGDYERKLAFLDDSGDHEGRLVTRSHGWSSEHHRPGSDHRHSSHDDTESIVSVEKHHDSKQGYHHYEDGHRRYQSNRSPEHHSNNGQHSATEHHRSDSGHHRSSHDDTESVISLDRHHDSKEHDHHYEDGGRNHHNSGKAYRGHRGDAHHTEQKHPNDRKHHDDEEHREVHRGHREDGYLGERHRGDHHHRHRDDNENEGSLVARGHHSSHHSSKHSSSAEASGDMRLEKHSSHSDSYREENRGHHRTDAHDRDHNRGYKSFDHELHREGQYLQKGSSNNHRDHRGADDRSTSGSKNSNHSNGGHYLEDEFLSRKQGQNRQGGSHRTSHEGHRFHNGLDYLEDGDSRSGRDRSDQHDRSNGHGGSYDPRYDTFEDDFFDYGKDGKSRYPDGDDSNRGYLGKGQHGGLSRFGDEFNDSRHSGTGSSRNGKDGNNGRHDGYKQFDRELEEWYGHEDAKGGNNRSKGKHHDDYEEPFFGHGKQSHSSDGRHEGNGLNRVFDPLGFDKEGGDLSKGKEGNNGGKSNGGKPLRNGLKDADNHYEDDVRNRKDDSKDNDYQELNRALEDWYGQGDDRGSKGQTRDGYEDPFFGGVAKQDSKSSGEHNGKGLKSVFNPLKYGKEGNHPGAGGDTSKDGSKGFNGVVEPLEFGKQDEQSGEGKEGSNSGKDKGPKTLKDGLKDEGKFYGDDLKKDEKHAQAGLQEEGNYWDKGLKKEGSHIDSGVHQGGNKLDEGLHDKSAKLDEGLHNQGEKVDKGAHSDANDVDDDMHHNGKKVDYRLHEYGTEALQAKHGLTSGDKQDSGKGQRSDSKSDGQGGSVLKEWFEPGKKKDSQRDNKSAGDNKSNEETVFIPKKAHIGVLEGTFEHI